MDHVGSGVRVSWDLKAFLIHIKVLRIENLEYLIYPKYTIPSLEALIKFGGMVVFDMSHKKHKCFFQGFNSSGRPCRGYISTIRVNQTLPCY